MANAAAMKNLDNLSKHIDDINSIISSAITNNAGKPNYVIARVIKAIFYEHHIFTASYWKVWLDSVCPRCYRLTLKNESGGPACTTTTYVRPCIMNKKDENGLIIENYLSAKRYRCTTKSDLTKFIDKYKSVLEGSKSSIDVSDEFKKNYAEKIELWKKAQKECDDYIENIYETVHGLSLEKYYDIVSELISNYESASGEKLLTERSVKIRFDSVNSRYWTDELKVREFDTFYNKKDKEISDYIKFDKNKDNYDAEVAKCKRRIMINLCEDYLLKTEAYRRHKLYEELPSDSSIYSISLDEALADVDPTLSQVGFVLKPDKNYLSRMIHCAYPYIYDYNELKERLKKAIKVAISYATLDKQSVADIKTLGKYATQTLKVKLNVEYLEPFMYNLDVYGALLPYMKPDVIDVYSNKVEVDTKNKIVHTVDIFAKKIRKEHGKTINAFLTCDDDAYEALTCAVDRFNRHSNRAKITDIRKSGTDKFFILVFLPKIVMTDDWDGRKFGLITKLANEEARSIGENIIRFAYDEFELDSWSGEEDS